MLVVLSPAKTLDFSEQKITNEYSLPELLDDSEILSKELKKLSESDISTLMKISTDLGRLNWERFQLWKKNYSVDNGKQAILAFKGEVYNGIKAWELKEDDLLFAQSRVCVLSGLYGVLRPLDLIMPYRLEMGTKLNNIRGKNLYEFWGEKVTHELNKQLASMKKACLVNLASNEYYKAVKTKMLNAQVITPQFKEEKDGKYKVVAVYAKKARGLMTRFIIDNRFEEVEKLKLFDADGYYFNDHLSTETEWVFTR